MQSYLFADLAPAYGLGTSSFENLNQNVKFTSIMLNYVFMFTRSNERAKP